MYYIVYYEILPSNVIGVEYFVDIYYSRGMYLHISLCSKMNLFMKNEDQIKSTWTMEKSVFYLSASNRVRTLRNSRVEKIIFIFEHIFEKKKLLSKSWDKVVRTIGRSVYYVTNYLSV